MQLLQDARFTDGSFDAYTLLESDVDQVIDADRSLREQLIKLSYSGNSSDTYNIQPLMDGSITEH